MRSRSALHPAFGAPMDGHGGLIEGMADMTIEFGILFGFDVFFLAGPQRRGLIERLFLVVDLHHDGQGDVI